MPSVRVKLSNYPKFGIIFSHAVRDIDSTGSLSNLTVEQLLLAIRAPTVQDADIVTARRVTTIMRPWEQLILDLVPSRLAGGDRVASWLSPTCS